MLIARHTEYLYNLLKDPYTKQAIDNALSEYPMYVPENKNVYSIIPTREQLNKKLLDHYQFREIGQEVPGMFIEELRVAMNEIMPYYYSLYKSADIMNGIDDPFGNVDITESYEQETEGTSKGTTSGTAEGRATSNAKTTSNTTSTTNTEMKNNSKNIESDRPQTLLQLQTEDIDSVNYANKTIWNEDKSNSNGTTKDQGETNDEGTSSSTSSSSGEASNETTGKTKHTLKRVGNQGVNTYAHDMKELREIFINIEQQIINDKRIKELFYLVFE